MSTGVPVEVPDKLSRLKNNIPIVDSEKPPKYRRRSRSSEASVTDASETPGNRECRDSESATNTDKDDKNKHKLSRQFSNSAPGLNPNSLNIINSVIIKKKRAKYNNIKAKIDVGKKPSAIASAANASKKASEEITDWNSEFLLEAKNTITTTVPKIINKPLPETMSEPSTSRPPDQMEIENTPEGEFILPRRTSHLSQTIIPVTSPTVTSNRYTTLNSDEMDHEEVTPATNRTNKPKNSPPNRSKRTKPPPIVIQGTTTDHKQLVKDISTVVKKGFFVKYARRSILIYIEDLNEYKNYKQQLSSENNVPFHTYTTNEAKTHAFVLRGLHKNIQTEEIKEDIEYNYDMKIINIFPMKTTFSPLYLIITTSDITLSALQNKIKHVLHTKITWERRRNERTITQCRNCQSWGHAASNCYRPPRCLICAENHLTRTCTLPRDATPTCANCKQSHTAASMDCPVYKFRLSRIENHQPEPTSFVPAPPPSENIWKQRQNQVQTREESNQPQPGPSHTNLAKPTREATTRGKPSTSTQAVSTISELTTLSDKINILNQKINLSEAVKAIEKLNEMLLNINNQWDAIQTLQTFIQIELPKFKILNSL